MQTIMNRFYFNIDRQFGSITTNLLNILDMNGLIKQTDFREVVTKPKTCNDILSSLLRSVKIPDREDLIVLYGSENYSNFEITKRLGLVFTKNLWFASVKSVWPRSVQWDEPIFGLRSDDNTVGDLLERVISLK
jgi:hypothetical protein